MKKSFTLLVLSMATTFAVTSCGALFGANAHIVTFDSNGGSAVVSQKIKHGEKVEKPIDPTRDGYTFNNWTYNGEEWSFNGYVVTEDMTLLANWNANTYRLTLKNSFTNRGSVSGAGSYAYDTDVTITAKPATGYSFLGWYDSKDTMVSDQTKYTFKMGFDLTLTAKWNKGNEYVVSLNPNSGTVSQTSVNVQYDKSYSLPVPERKGYTFDGWYSGSTKVSNSGTWKYDSNKSFTAHWSIITYSINYTLNGGANNSSNPSTYTVEDLITLLNPTHLFGTFDGWYLNDKLITIIEKGTTGDLNLAAKWSQTEEQKTEEASAKKYATKPFFSDDGKTITYGLYPQKNINDSSLLTALNGLAAPESNGWYLYDGEYYAKVNASPENSSCAFDNRTTIVSDTTYWFKCEPITWKILSENNGEYYLLSTVLLDAHRYDALNNNYKNSEIRSWLNNDFYKSAFALGSNYIKTTTVDNSAATTSSNSNPYACENTEDKVFLPSYRDYYDSNYGFSEPIDRCCKTTDWARARGASYNSFSSEYYYNGYYWTRSPYSDFSYCARGVSSDGFLYNSNGNNNIGNTSYCARPSITLKIS